MCEYKINYISVDSLLCAIVIVLACRKSNAHKGRRFTRIIAEGLVDVVEILSVVGELTDSVCNLNDSVLLEAVGSEAILLVDYQFAVLVIGSGGALSGEVGSAIKAKTIGQRKYVDTIKKNTIVLGLGPAGTGKTFLAVAMAVEALRNKSVNRIILTRPAVEAGEHLGFLPGDLQSKIDPYLRPLYDALFEMLGAENYQRHIERGVIEIAPLAYMRGRTLDDSFIILDEAQNTTPEQMKMFLTRIGYNTKAVVTGDLSQTDLPMGKKSGLSIAARILQDIEGIGIFEFSERDVVRHHLVKKIINAYEAYEKNQSRHRNEDSDKRKN